MNSSLNCEEIFPLAQREMTDLSSSFALLYWSSPPITIRTFSSGRKQKRKQWEKAYLSNVTVCDSVQVLGPAMQNSDFNIKLSRNIFDNSNHIKIEGFL